MKNLVVAGVAIAGLVIMFGCLRTMKRCGPYRASVISLSIAAASMLLSQFQVRHFAFLTRPIVCSSVAVVLLAASWLLLPTKPDKHSRTGALRTSTTALVAVAVWLLVIDFSVASGLSGRVVATRLVAVAVVVMLVSLCRSEVARFEFVALALAFAFGVACATAPLASDAYRACSQFKCGPLGAQLTAAFGSENRLSIICCLTILGAFSFADRAFRFFVVVTGLCVLYLADSRTEQIALAVALIVGAVWFLTSRSEGAAWRGLSAAALPNVGVAIGIYLIYSASVKSFSNRGSIWILGRSALGHDWLVGRGLDTWSTQVLSRNFMHSEYLYLLYSGGVVALLLFAIALTGVGVRLARTGDWNRFALLVFIVIDGMTEVIWNPLTVDDTTILAVLLISISRWDPPLLEGALRPDQSAASTGGGRNGVRARKPPIAVGPNMGSGGHALAGRPQPRSQDPGEGSTHGA